MLFFTVDRSCASHFGKQTKNLHINQLFICNFYNYLNYMETIRPEQLSMPKFQLKLQQINQNQNESEVYPMASQAFLNKILQIQDFFQESSQVKNHKGKSKTKRIKRKRGKNSLEGKWTVINKLNYYKAILKFSTDNPHFKISWQYWKPEKFYPKMVQQINKGQTLFKKSVIQCKSFDQRQRKQHFDSGLKLDMIQLSLYKLKCIENQDKQAKTILQSYKKKMEQKSEHMRLLEASLSNIKSEKLQLEELFDDILGMKQKQSDGRNCFYF